MQTRKSKLDKKYKLVGIVPGYSVGHICYV